MSDELKDRVREIELMLGMVLRLPEGSGKKARMDAFRGAVDGIISNAEQNGRSGFKEVESKYLQVDYYVFCLMPLNAIVQFNFVDVVVAPLCCFFISSVLSVSPISFSYSLSFSYHLSALYTHVVLSSLLPLSLTPSLISQVKLNQTVSYLTTLPSFHTVNTECTALHCTALPPLTSYSLSLSP